MRIPKNLILKRKYTSGKEYILANSYKDYVGYYYELNNKTYGGSEFNINAPEIIKVKSKYVNSLLKNSQTFIYGKISKIVLNNINPASHIFKSNEDGNTTRYFSKQTNINPTIIKEINEDTFEELKQNPIYQIVSIEYNISKGYNQKEKAKAIQTIPELETFLEIQG